MYIMYIYYLLFMVQFTPEQYTVSSVIKSCCQLASVKQGQLLAGPNGPALNEEDPLKGRMYFRGKSTDFRMSQNMIL